VGSEGTDQVLDLKDCRNIMPGSRIAYQVAQADMGRSEVGQMVRKMPVAGTAGSYQNFVGMFVQAGDKRAQKPLGTAKFRLRYDKKNTFHLEKIAVLLYFIKMRPVRNRPNGLIITLNCNYEFYDF
jgi:hypothetical protein